MTIKKATVLGAGVMGAQIAGHLAGCGIPVRLLDLNNELVSQGLERLKKSKPAAMFDSSDLKLISTGTFEKDLNKISDSDWIVEAVVEKLEIKQKLFVEVEKYLKPVAIISSNTSGILLKEMVEGRNENFRKNFVITHFFNPVRYMKLVELIPGPDTNPKVTKEMALILEDLLGKGVVYAKDTPNFIANRIGIHAVIKAFELVAEKNVPIEVVDQVMGVPTARPKSAIFRTADIVGIDTLAHVARNSGLKLPAFVEEMVSKGWIGSKAGQGFYKKIASHSSLVASKDKQQATSNKQQATEILVLDPKTMEYRPQSKIKTESLGKVRSLDDPAERLKVIFNSEDEAGKIAKPLIEASIKYSADILDEVADNAAEVDKAMRWGFGWELGPFEQAHALEFQQFQQFQPCLTGRQAFQPPRPNYKKIEGNGGADLLDIGDGVFACEFHTKMNAIDADIIEMIGKSVGYAEKNGKGLVLTGAGPNFSAGANLMLIWMAATNDQWDQVEDMVRKFQAATQLLRFSKRPIVAAPFGMALGGGCEVSMSSGHIQAAAETYMGLVEVGVGVVPAGGGCKNLLLRMEERHRKAYDSKNNIWVASKDGGPFPKVSDVFQAIAFAKISTSGKEAKKIGYMSSEDGIVLDKEKLIESAKRRVLDLSKTYLPEVMREDIELPGDGGKMALVNGIRQARLKGQVTEYETVIGEKLAHILTGGDKPSVHKTTEQHILDLEREAFLSLCGNKKTQERMQHMLQKGKPLRN